MKRLGGIIKIITLNIATYIRTKTSINATTTAAIITYFVAMFIKKCFILIEMGKARFYFNCFLK